MRPIPPELRTYRDKLRIIGFDLVRVSQWEATDRAKHSFGHDASGYEYTIVPIQHIDEQSGQIYLRGVPEPSKFFSSACAPRIIEDHLKKESPSLILRDILSDRGNQVGIAALAAIALPYMLAALSLEVASEYRKLREAKRRAKLLPRLREMPQYA
jgi:hypothetical protein